MKDQDSSRCYTSLLHQGGVTAEITKIRDFLDTPQELSILLEHFDVEDFSRHGSFLEREVIICAVRSVDVAEYLWGADGSPERGSKLMERVPGWERVPPTRRFGLRARWWMRIDRDHERRDDKGYPLGWMIPQDFEPWPV